MCFILKFPLFSAVLEEIKERQKLRQRPHGVSVIGLALGKKLAPEEEIAIVSSFPKAFQTNL